MSDIEILIKSLENASLQSDYWIPALERARKYKPHVDWDPCTDRCLKCGLTRIQVMDGPYLQSCKD